MYEHLESAFHERTESPLHEFLTQGEPLTIAYQVLAQYKRWPGIRPFDQYGEVSDVHALPSTYAQRVACRMRYKTKTTLGQITGGASYTAKETLVGLGFSPSSTGHPNGVVDLDYSADRYFEYNSGRGPTSYDVGWMYPDVDHRPSVTPTQLTWAYRDDLNLGIPPPNWVPWNITGTQTLSEPILFAPELKRAGDALKARVWTELEGFSDETDGIDPISGLPIPLNYNNLQRFDEYGGSCYGAPVGPSYSGAANAPVPGDADLTVLEVLGNYTLATWPLLVSPAFADPGWGVNVKSAASFWVYHAFNDWDLCPWPISPPGSYDSVYDIYARRYRFQVRETTHHYFIVRALLLLDSSRSPFGGSTMKVKLHPKVALVEEGDLAPNTPKEVPLPYASGHETWGDFCRVGDALSIGAIAFAILDETPAAWCARTGYAIADTADDPVYTGDQG